jgi:hypothetical protein
MLILELYNFLGGALSEQAGILIRGIVVAELLCPLLVLIGWDSAIVEPFLIFREYCTLGHARPRNHATLQQSWFSDRFVGVVGIPKDGNEHPTSLWWLQTTNFKNKGILLRLENGSEVHSDTLNKVLFSMPSCLRGKDYASLIFECSIPPS